MILIKYFITAAIVIVVSELAKRSDRLGAVVAALPLVTILTLIWLHAEKQAPEKLANHMYYTFWYVLPTLPMFLVYPYLQSRIGFWPTLLSCCVLTALIFLLSNFILKRFNISLM
jgi:hypothetical protein